jgi:hypothetical protein
VNSKDEDQPEDVNVIYDKVDEGGTMFFPDFVNLAFDLKSGTIHKFNMCEKEDLDVLEHQYQRSTGWACSQEDDETEMGETSKNEKTPKTTNKIFYNCGNFHVPTLKLDVGEETRRFLQVLSRNPKFCLDYFSTSPHCEPNYFVDDTVEKFKYILENEGKEFPELNYERKNVEKRDSEMSEVVGKLAME